MEEIRLVWSEERSSMSSRGPGLDLNLDATQETFVFGLYP